jgi:hypothetical protein
VRSALGRPNRAPAQVSEAAPVPEIEIRTQDSENDAPSGSGKEGEHEEAYSPAAAGGRALQTVALGRQFELLWRPLVLWIYNSCRFGTRERAGAAVPHDPCSRVVRFAGSAVSASLGLRGGRYVASDRR